MINITRIIQAILVAVAVGLLCLLLGVVLNAVGVPPATAVGGFLTQYAWAIGVVSGLWFYFFGGAFPKIGS